jgi:hypothetical protein
LKRTTARADDVEVEASIQLRVEAVERGLWGLGCDFLDC